MQTYETETGACQRRAENVEKWQKVAKYIFIQANLLCELLTPAHERPNPPVTADDLSNTDKGIPTTCRCLHLALTKHNTHYWQSHFTPGTKLERHYIVQILLHFTHPYIIHPDVLVNVVISFNYGLIKYYLVIFIININLAWITATIN